MVMYLRTKEVMVDLFILTRLASIKVKMHSKSDSFLGKYTKMETTSQVMMIYIDRINEIKPFFYYFYSCSP